MSEQAASHMSDVPSMVPVSVPVDITASAPLASSNPSHASENQKDNGHHRASDRHQSSRRNSRSRSRSRSRNHSRSPRRSHTHHRSGEDRHHRSSHRRSSSRDRTSKPSSSNTQGDRFADRFDPDQAKPKYGRGSRSRSRSHSRSRRHSPRRRSRSSSRRRSSHRRHDSTSRSRSRSRSRSKDRSRQHRRHRSSRSRSHSRSRSGSRSRASARHNRWDQRDESTAGAGSAPSAIQAATGEEAYLRRVAASQQQHGGYNPSAASSSGHGNPRNNFNEPLPPLFSIHTGTVARVQPFGAFMSLPGFRRQGLLHASKIISGQRIENAADILQVGAGVYVKVIQIDPSTQKIGLSATDVDQSTGADLDPENIRANEGNSSHGVGGGGGHSRPPQELPELYTIHRAKVAKIEKFGAFVDILPAEGSAAPASSSRRSLQGLVHISQMSNSRRVDNVEDVLSIGDEILVKVVKIENGKLGLSLRDVDQATGEDLDPSNSRKDKSSGGGGGGMSNEAPALYSIHKGKVAKLSEFGAFVSIDGFRKHGLVHISQLAPYKVDSVDKAVSMDEAVWVKVMKVEEGGSKIGLSMKYVNQTTGKDLDPQNTNSAADEARHNKSANFDSNQRRNQPIELGAIHNATCTRCGAAGHLAVDCLAAEGAKYDSAADARAGEEAEKAQRASEKAAAEKSSSLSRIQEALAIIQAAKEEKKAKKAAKKLKKEAKKHKKEKKSKSKKDSSKKKKKDKRRDSSSSDDSSSGSDSD